MNSLQESLHAACLLYILNVLLILLGKMTSYRLDDFRTLYDNEEVKKYLIYHQVPDLIEALLTAVAFYKSELPLKEILLHLKKIKEYDFNEIQICWDFFIKPQDLPVSKVFKSCFIEQFILDSPFYREKNHKQMITSIEHYCKVQLKKYFAVLRVYHHHCLTKKMSDQRNVNIANNHYWTKLKKRVINNWSNGTKIYATNITRAITILQKSLSYTYKSRCFVRWRLFTKDIHWKNNYFQKQALKQASENNANAGNENESDNTKGDQISSLKAITAVKIFKYLDLKSRISCSTVCNAWHDLMQDSSLYTELNLSDSASEINDARFLSVIRRYKFFLYHLKLANCIKISSKVLSNLKECKNLQDIDLTACQVTSGVLQDIGVGCPFVTYLNLSNSMVDDACFAAIAKHFPSMRFLDLSNCSALSEAGFYYLVTSRSLKGLAHFNLSGCSKINGNCLANIGQCCLNLTSLILDCIPNLTDECISKMAATCGRLRILSLMQAVRLTDKALKYISISIQQLEKIFIEGNKFITDAGVANLMGLKNLRHIHLVDCLRVYDNGLKPCANMRQLSVVNLTDCIRLTDGGIKYILESPSAHYLKELLLTNCIRVGDQTVQKIISSCPGLTYLSLAYCENVTDVGIAMLARHNSLHMLDISGCPINDSGAGSLKQAQNLRYLSIAECNLLSDIGIERMSKMENLSYLDISFCTNISDYGMKMLIFENKCLTTLNLAGCKLLTNSTLSSVASVCEYLQNLNVSENKNITDKGIRFIRTGCKKLKYLNLSCCPKLNYGSISKMVINGCHVVHTL